eukprot:5041222-Prymnesium_polylepis.1
MRARAKPVSAREEDLEAGRHVRPADGARLRALVDHLAALLTHAAAAHHGSGQQQQHASAATSARVGGACAAHTRQATARGRAVNMRLGVAP